MTEFSINNRIASYAQKEVEDILYDLNTTLDGLSESEIENHREKYGNNRLIKSNNNILHRLRRSFINPFSIVLTIIGIISLILGILDKQPFNNNFISVIIITIMIITSGIVRFTQELKSKKIMDTVASIIDLDVQTKRDGCWKSISSEDLVVGDIIALKAGDRVPADIRIIRNQDCFISQAMINGESEIQEKNSSVLKSIPSRLTDYTNVAFMGSSITSGYLEGIVIAVGEDTTYGCVKVDSKNSKNGFDKGSSSIAFVLIRFIAILIPIVFIASGLTKGDWLAAFLFALSVAVGLTPELLPMVITACLAKGSANMGKKETIVKDINAMQAFGSMDVLCVDKTGTLTNNELILEYYLDIIGNEEQEVLDIAYLNSYFHTGEKNYIDNAILKVYDYEVSKEYYEDLVKDYYKLDEIPFDENRRFSSILIAKNNNRKIIIKGSLNDVIKRCVNVKYKDQVIPIEDDVYKNVHSVVDELLESGIKVLAVAEKSVCLDNIEYQDENELTLLGYIAFFDAPKKSAVTAISKLNNLNIKVKVLTGDNAQVAMSICKRIGIDTSNIIIGEDLENLTSNDIQVVIENTSVFAELTPKQKAQIVEVLKSNGHSVGFLADGINDIPAVLESDVGISVDTAGNSVKEVSDVILMKKDLNVLEEGVLEGRRSFANMLKYIKITASSNLGNIIAIVIASIFLPFFPMTAIQLLLLNLLYDILCLVLPWDYVDTDMCKQPLEWSGRNLSRFMLYFGPISSIFDIITFVFLLFYLCPAICGGAYSTLNIDAQMRFISIFQTGWFLESMWTQVLIIHLLRTKNLPLVQSKPSTPVLGITLLGVLLFTFLVMTPIGELIGLTILPGIYFVFLACVVICYLLLVTLMKKFYVKKYTKLI